MNVLVVREGGKKFTGNWGREGQHARREDVIVERDVCVGPDARAVITAV